MIFQIIFEEDNIKNVRLTCKIFEKLATPLLLRRVVCGPFLSSLAALTALSRHPVLSRSVVEVVYVCDRYRFFQTLREYKEALRRASLCGKFEEPKSEKENFDLKRAFSQYSQAYNDQTTMEESGEVLAGLCGALIRMPNVETITISPNFDCYLESYHYSIYSLKPDPGYSEAFLLMARAVSLSGTKIRDLEIERDDDLSRDPEGIIGAVFQEMSDTNLSHCCNTFRGLRNVTITTNGEHVDGWTTGNLAKILSSATKLESLCLHCCDGFFHIPTKHVLGTTTWSRLASLDFAYTNLDQGEFLHLLKRHSHTLTNLNLFCVCLRNGSWKPLLEEVKSSLSLRHFSINHLAEDDWEEIYLDQGALDNYLFENGPYPLPE